LAGKGFNVSFKGLDNLYSQLNLSAKEARNVTKTAMKQTLSKAAESSQRVAPVDTGYLRRNIQPEPVRGEGDVITGRYVAKAEYSSYNEYGTYKMSARPFMRTGTTEATPFFYKAVEQALKKAGDMI